MALALPAQSPSSCETSGTATAPPGLGFSLRNVVFSSQHRVSSTNGRVPRGEPLSVCVGGVLSPAPGHPFPLDRWPRHLQMRPAGGGGCRLTACPAGSRFLGRPVSFRGQPTGRGFKKRECDGASASFSGQHAGRGRGVAREFSLPLVLQNASEDTEASKHPSTSPWGLGRLRWDRPDVPVGSHVSCPAPGEGCSGPQAGRPWRRADLHSVARAGGHSQAACVCEFRENKQFCGDGPLPPRAERTSLS